MSARLVEVVGGTYEELVRGAEFVRRGVPVEVLAAGGRAGSPYLTESFLTPFRFNLGPALVPRPRAVAIRVVEPDPLLAVGDAVLARDLEEIPRSLLLALGLLLGIDPEAPDGNENLAAAARDTGQLVAIEGGNGLLAAVLLDEIVAGGGRVVDGVAPTMVDRGPSGIGICRLFVGLRARPPAQRAFADAYGFADEAELRARLAELRRGASTEPVGFLLSNRHLDPRRTGDPLGSFVWQGYLPAATSVDRGKYAADVRRHLGVAERDVLFSLLWGPDETGERLR